MSTKNRDSDIPNKDDAFEDYEELFFSKGTQSAEVVSKPVQKQKPNDGNDEEDSSEDFGYDGPDIDVEMPVDDGTPVHVEEEVVAARVMQVESVSTDVFERASYDEYFNNLPDDEEEDQPKTPAIAVHIGNSSDE